MIASLPRALPRMSVRLLAGLLPLVLIMSWVVHHPIPFAVSTTTVPTFPSKTVVPSNWGKLPLSFVPNTGQAAPAVRFQLRGPGGTLFFTPQEIVLSLPTSAGARAARRGQGQMLSDRPGQHGAGQVPTPAPEVVRLQWERANANSELVGTEQLAGVVNSFVGNDPTHWRTQLPTYSGVMYRGLYPGIDLHYDGYEGQMEGTYSVAPGSDVGLIRWHYRGARAVSVDDAGNLVVTVGQAAGSNDQHERPAARQTIVERAPVAWQVTGGQQRAVAARYAVSADGGIQFEIGAYDHLHVLTIDPTITWSSYLGGSGSDGGASIAVDRNGNVLVTGETSSPNFPVINAFQPAFGGGDFDAFVTKLSASGSLMWTTYLGGSGHDEGLGLAVDGSGNVLVTGETSSPNFPVANAFQSAFGGYYNAFVTKLSTSGSLVWSSYLGGTGSGESDAGYGIVVDGSSNVVVTGGTYSTNFPTVHAFQATPGGGLDAFVTKVSASGSLVWSSYLGGSNDDNGFGIAVDGSGNVVVTGNTASTNFPTSHAVQATPGGGLDAFVTSLSMSGSLVWSSYLGGSNEDTGYGVAVDGSGNVLITGLTASLNFPTIRAVQPTFGGGTYDALVVKLSSSGGLLWSSYLGGSGDDYANAISVDGSGNALVTGVTYSTNFPTASAFQATFGGGRDVFVTKLSASGSLVWSSYLGGSSSDGGRGIAVAGSGNVLVTGRTASPNFPTASAFQPAFAGGDFDAFVSQIAEGGGSALNKVYIPLCTHR